MVKKIKIKLDDLDKDSTPCEICVAMNGREIETDKSRHYFNRNYCYTKTFSDYIEKAIGGRGCTDVDRAQIRIEFLNYIEHRKPKER